MTRSPVDARVVAALLFVLVACLQPSARAADARQLMNVYEQLRTCRVDPAATIDVQGFVLERYGTRVTFDSGRVAFLAPVMVDSAPLTFGAYFEGKGRFGFTPPAAVERHALRTYFDQDALDGSFDRLLLFYTDGLLDSLREQGQASVQPFTPSEVGGAAGLLYERKDEPHEFFFALLRNLTDAADDPFLWINADPKGVGRVICIHDPREREEIVLYKIHWEPGGSVMDRVISCSRMLGADHARINGQDKSRVRIAHYDLDCSITQQGDFSGTARVTGKAVRQPVQLLRLWLHPELTVRSVRDGTGADVHFMRHEHADYPSWYLYLFLDRPLKPLEDLVLTVEYDGEDMIIERIGQFYMTAHSFWYPSTEERGRSTFDLTFKTPAALEFVATGVPTARQTEGDWLVTKWSVQEPASNVSFSLGAMKKYEFEDKSVGRVDVYYSEDLHADLAGLLVSEGNLVGKHMERHVSEDVLNAFKLFTHDFGAGPATHLAVSEVMGMHGESFPGFLHMGLPTWVATDVWGYDRLFRAHEVAHQWWGTGVGYDTYHDQWLSEGMAEYSALLYLQAADGNDRFLKTLRDYRDDIFSEEKLGPVALGGRNSTRDLPDGYQIAVYKKGAYVIHMLRNLLIDLGSLDDARFFDLMRQYYRTYRGKDATTRDFRAVAETYAGTDLGWFFDQWIYGTALPTYRFRYDIVKKDNGSYTAECIVDVEDVPAEFKMFVPVEVELEKHQKAYLRFLIEGPQRRFEIAGLPGKPKKVRLNPFESVLARVSP